MESIVERHLGQRAQAVARLLKLEWLGIYQILSGPENVAHLAASVGKGPSQTSFKVADGNPALGSEILEPIRFQDDLLGFIGANGSSNGGGNNGETSEELQSLAAQLGCFFNSKNKERTVAIDALVDQIHRGHPDKYHWTGVYLVNKSGLLELEAFRGEPSPHMVIHPNSGICGAAVRERKLLNVADVDEDPRYLSCSLKTKSEIVVPIMRTADVVGEIDIDSHVKNAFTRHNEMELKDYAEKLEKLI